MRAGLMLGTGGDPGGTADQAIRAERRGFDLVAAGLVASAVLPRLRELTGR